MGPERIELSGKERERLKVLRQVEEGHLQQIEAARRLRLSDRQVRRLQARLRTEGDAESCIDCAAAARTGRCLRAAGSAPYGSCARPAMRVLAPRWRPNIWRAAES